MGMRRKLGTVSSACTSSLPNPWLTRRAFLFCISLFTAPLLFRKEERDPLDGEPIMESKASNVFGLEGERAFTRSRRRFTPLLRKIPFSRSHTAGWDFFVLHEIETTYREISVGSSEGETIPPRNGRGLICKQARMPWRGAWEAFSFSG